MLTAVMAREIEAALGEPVHLISRMTGGCISPAARVQSASSRDYFLKTETDRAGLLAAEAFALQHIAATHTVRVPDVIAAGAQWLLLEWIEPGAAGVRDWSNFGRTLAQLHRVQNESFGWPQDNFIGSLPQSNNWCANWADFWRSERLEPQLQQALRAGRLNRADERNFQVLFQQLGTLLAAGDREGASLLHGDLWSGNALAGKEGMAAVDPSSYYGHREVDLAMAALFGGFATGFWDSYQEAWPLLSEAFEQRRAAYQLYYLLVHVNLFGSSYVQGVRQSLRTAID